MMLLPRMILRRIASGLAILAALAGLTLTAPGAALAASGTQWCPAPSVYGDPGCTVTTTIQAAVDLAAAAGVPGTVYVVGGLFDEAVVVEGLSDVALIGSADSSGPTVIGDDLTIRDSREITVESFTVTDGIEITGGRGTFSLDNNIAGLIVRDSQFSNPDWHGLAVTNHSGPVTLEDVRGEKSHDCGVYINNLSSGTAPVSVTGGEFRKNGDDGLRIESRGQITLRDISATKNADDGANLYSPPGTGGVNVNVLAARQNRFEKNGGRGLYVYTGSTIAVAGIRANKNGSDGARLVNESGGDDVLIDPSPAGPNQFDKNGGGGLMVNSRGGIYLTDTSASKNGGDGVYLNNHTGVGPIQISTTAASLNRFEKNGGAGLYLWAQGEITLEDLSASKNLSGAVLNNSGGSGGVTVSRSRASLNRFDRNSEYGLVVHTDGAISLSDLSATGNGTETPADGAYLDTTGASATLTCSAFNANSDDGIQAMLGGGTLTLNSVTATGNGGLDVNFFGTRVDNVVVCP